MNGVLVERVVFGEVPCLFVSPYGWDGSSPSIIHFHGWSSKKENHQLLAQIWASHGYSILIPDALNHGERNVTDHDQDPHALENYFWETVLDNLDRYKDLRDAAHIAGRLGEQLFVSGSSMGGFSALALLTEHQEIDGGIIFNGAGDWGKVLSSFGVVPNEGNEDLISRIYQWNPLARVRELRGRPCLLMHGEKDSVVKMEFNRVFYETASPYYRAYPERLQWESYPRLDHYITIQMIERSVQFLDMHVSAKESNSNPLM